MFTDFYTGTRFPECELATVVPSNALAYTIELVDDYYNGRAIYRYSFTKIDDETIVVRAFEKLSWRVTSDGWWDSPIKMSVKTARKLYRELTTLYKFSRIS